MSLPLTPGPWEYWQSAGKDDGVDDEFTVGAQPKRHDPEDEPWTWKGVCEGLSSEANARLIAAAPDLLETLKAAHNYLDDVAPLLDGDDANGGVRTVLARIRAGLAKAEGRS